MITKQVADKVVLKHQYITVPTSSKADAIAAVANKLAQVTLDETSTSIRDTEKDQLTQLATIFNSVATKETDKKAQTAKNMPNR